MHRSQRAWAAANMRNRFMLVNCRRGRDQVNTRVAFGAFGPSLKDSVPFRLEKSKAILPVERVSGKMRCSQIVRSVISPTSATGSSAEWGASEKGRFSPKVASKPALAE